MKAKLIKNDDQMIFPVDFNFLKTTIIRSIIAEHMKEEYDVLDHLLLLRFELQYIRLDTGNFAWASEATARKTRIIDVVYNACNNELVRTKTLVKNAIVVIDAAPFRQW